MVINASVIKRSMNKQGMTQTELARLSGISKYAISNILARSTAKPESVRKIAAALNIEATDIYGGFEA